jgi:hypothetical protein
VSATSDELTVGVEPGAAPGHRRARHRRRWTIVAIVLVLAAAGAVSADLTRPYGVDFAHPLGQHQHAASGTQDNSTATSTATVTRQSLSQTTAVSGTLGYAGDYTVLGQLQGTITALPAVGQVIRQDQVLYRVDSNPVVLLYGSTPAYRTLKEGATAADVTGQDVAELNHDLVVLGYVDKSDVDSAWDEFGWATKAGIEKLQEHLGVDQTGELDLGQVVFLPTAARVTSLSAKLGGPATGAVLSAMSTTRQITVNLDASLQSLIHKGDTVTITLPDKHTTPGVVSSVGTVATTPSGTSASNSTPTIPVQITPTRPADTGSLDQAPVQVAISTATVHNALTVQVNALLALSGGGYAVEVADADGTHHLVTVSLGLFDDADGLVQVTGSGLAAGQHVVVPAS